jgi:hypothetical protein
VANQRVEIATMRTPDGHSRLEPARFVAPPVISDRSAPVNALRYLRVMFAVSPAAPHDEHVGLDLVLDRGLSAVGDTRASTRTARTCWGSSRRNGRGHRIDDIPVAQPGPS